MTGPTDEGAPCVPPPPSIEPNVLPPHLRFAPVDPFGPFDPATATTATTAGALLPAQDPPPWPRYALRTAPSGLDPVRGRPRLEAEDVRLPGVLPLVLARRHHGRTRAGRAFGAVWASTLDQRLLLRESSVLLVAEDGRLLTYPSPRPGSGRPVLPFHGPHWPLTWDGAPGGPITVRRADTGHTLRFRPLPCGPGAELPLTSLADGRGNHLALRHDAFGRPVEIVHSAGYRLGIDNGEGGRVAAVRLLNAPDAPALLRCRYDEEGNLTEAENAAGAVESYAYDQSRRMVRYTDRAGDTFRYGYDGNGRVRAVEGPGGLLSRTVSYAGRRTTVTDALGHVWTFERNTRGHLVAETDPLGNTTRYVRDREGRPRTVTDPLERATAYRHDRLGNRVESHFPDDTRATTRYDPRGRPLAHIAEDGGTTLLTWDGQGRLESVTSPVGRVTRLGHHAGGGLATLTDPLGAVWRYACDRAGLPTAVTDPAGETTRLERDHLGAVVRIISPQGERLCLERDALGQITALRHPSGAVERWTRDAGGRPLTHTDAAGRTTRWERGPLGLCLAVCHPDGRVVRYRHDREGRPTRITDPTGRDWEYVHDAAGRLVEAADLGDRPIRLRHDAAGQCVGWTNGAAQRLSLRFDARGRLVERRTELDRELFHYDPVGRLIGAESTETTLARTLDGSGSVLAETVNGRTVSMRYDAAGRRTARRTPSGTETTWAYDAVGRVVALRVDQHAVALELDASGRESGRAIGGSGALRQSWGPAGRLAGQTLLSGSSRRHRTWEYGVDGRLWRTTDEVAGTVEFARDPAGRPVLVRDRTGPHPYSYDALGQLTGDGRKFEGPLLVVDTEGVSYRHDARGRVVAAPRKLPSGSVGSCLYTWDALDRLTDVVMPDGRHWHYVHDPLGRRVAKQLLDGFGEVEERVLLDWEDALPAEQTYPDGTVTSWHWVPGDHRRPLAQTGRFGSSSPVFHGIVTDPDGSPTELVDARGDIAWRRRATPFGAPTGLGSDTAHCPLGFAGQLYDEETGLFYDFHRGHRPYDPTNARYLAPLPHPTHPFTGEAAPSP
ncbi:DUF6531 domain-containing protein [Streptomyces profundus]|uniref:DUF6531 domain-containing protein n=1 Tax=Streptomyces profundus TaxID=2867410 RepID=UPI001D1637B1|nr:DUF6531 domain-containing protein [Streptomyces sp. MA3_2.13]UED86612.1 DUF6531 domain-containing protein [Streptomyces sp. MA3_2.13]